MAEILTLKSNYNPDQSREGSREVRLEHLRYQVYFVIINVEFLVTVLTITY